MPLGPRLLLAPLLLAVLSLAACGQDDPVRLEVTVQDWTGWSREQPDPVVATHELAEGDTFTVDVIGEDELVVTVVQVDDGEVALETSAPMASEDEDGGSDITDPRTEFSLDRGGSVEFGTPTLDGGTTVTVAEQ
ncbi:hypothetical protein QI633_18735 [Nocardioides sp. QY071]|uniref:hypothetical protein n=1 Tax=Nocardioides sp. QY071 TaxID=3044187 RepID=UPI00249CE6FC|nr:hypothetical protein [Nocardioides sp. QY071]WGY00572.1 hypothetical protein QI633_18735 [Nocardioides sp. QY071]